MVPITTQLEVSKHQKAILQNPNLTLTKNAIALHCDSYSYAPHYLFHFSIYNLILIQSYEWVTASYRNWSRNF